jgi:hypothetical protein
LRKSHGSRRGQGAEGEYPREDETQESRGCRAWRNQAAVAPTGRGSKPLKRGRSGRNAYAPKAQEAPLKREGRAFGGLSEEPALWAANLVRCEIAGLVSAEAVGRQSQEGKRC